MGPDGTIYPCQRFAGMPQFGLGDVHAAPSADALVASPVWQAFAAREQHMAESCGNCSYLVLCRGGCPYNAVVEGGGTLAPTADDPHCEAYRRTFSAITERAMVEVFARDNLEAVVARPDPERGLLRHGRLLSLMSGGSHPRDAARRTRRIAAARPAPPDRGRMIAAPPAEVILSGVIDAGPEEALPRWRVALDDSSETAALCTRMCLLVTLRRL